MVKKSSIFIFSFFLALLLFICFCTKQATNKNIIYKELSFVKESALSQIHSIMNTIALQNKAFANILSQDRDFSMKFFVENNKSAPEILEIASKYISPMGFSFLTVTDSKFEILSCGHFLANAGSKFESAELFGDSSVFVMDNIKGEKVLSLQSKTKLKILDTDFYVFGGINVEKDLLPKIFCPNDYSIFIKQGKNIYGNQKIESISEIKDSTIIINNIIYPAFSVNLPFIGSEENLQLIVVKKTSLK
jgi:hypothetical protein